MKTLLVILIFALIFLAPSALAEGMDSWEEVEAVFASAYEKYRTSSSAVRGASGAVGTPPVTFTLSRRLLKELKADKTCLCSAAARAGFRTIAWTMWDSGKVEITSMEPYNCPFMTVTNERELSDAVSRMREAGAKEFALLTDRELYDSLKSGIRRKKILLLQAGLFSWEFEYSGDSSLSLQYTRCEYWDGAVFEADSEEKALAAMEKAGDLGYDSFALALDGGTYKSLTSSEKERLFAMMAEAYVESGFSLFSDFRIIVFRGEGQPVFYPGYVILRAVRNGSEDKLPLRLRETLKAARRMTDGLSGTDKEVAVAVHDLLCSRVTYTVDDSTDEDDRCVGAILNGKANCDGYADAFLLLCGLKGIPVKLVQGDGLKASGPKEEDASHMWNLILLDGVWRGVDVTWDDEDGGNVSYIHFNMGEDRMRSNYRFIPDFLPRNLMRSTDLLDRPEPEFSVTTGDEVIGALRTAMRMRKTKAILWMNEKLYQQYKKQNPIWKWMDLAGVTGKVSHSDETRKVIISGIQAPGSGNVTAEADSVSGIIEIMRSSADARTLTVYCSEALYLQYKAPDNPVWKWMDLAGITGSVSYSDDSRRIVIADIRPQEYGTVTCEADSVSGIIEMMRSSSNARTLRVYCSKALWAQYKAAENPVWKWMDLAGITGKVSYADDSRRIVITEIAPLGASVIAAEADTEKEFIAILRGADRKRVTEVRIYCSRSLFSAYTRGQNKIWDWLESGGAADASVRYSAERRVIYVIDIKWK